jgi:formylglycine-generating enzyme
MKKLIFSTLFAIGLIGSASIKADTFGTGANQFSIDFVTIGNPGNVSDPATGYGAVPYTYRIGKYTISQNQVNAALANGLQHVYSDTIHDAVRLVGTYAGPASDITWLDAAAFVNWLNTSSGYPPAYNLIYTNGAWSMSLWPGNQAWVQGGTNLFRNALCHYFMPSDNEWYKAAYYDPNKFAGIGGYWLYTTGSDTPPEQVSNAQLGKGGAGWNSGGGGTNPGTTVWGLSSWCAGADVTQSGGLSPYGTMGQGGNMAQWVETTADNQNNNPTANRKAFGYPWWWWFYTSDFKPFSSIDETGLLNLPSFYSSGAVGIRVASIDESYPQVTPLAITSQPSDVSLTATNSQTATFSVVATNGVPPYAYQWMKDGVDLTNQTNASLVLSNAGANTVGYYSCQVMDANSNSVISSNAALNISGVPFWLWQGLLGYWPLNGNANDEGIHNFNGIIYNLQPCTDRFGVRQKALFFNGNSGYVDVGNHNEFNFGYSDFSFTSWVKLDPDCSNGYILSKYVVSQTGSYGYGTTPYGNSYAFISGSKDFAGGGGNQNLKDNEWHQIVASYSRSSALTIYVDGKTDFFSNISVANQYQSNNLSLRIGRLDDGSSYADWFKGCISDIRIYNRALSSNEVSALFQSEAVPTLSQTITFPIISSHAYGSAAFTLGATSSAGANYPITYTSSDSNIASIVGYTVTICGAGTATITASQAGGYPWKAATPVQRQLTITKVKQSMSGFTPISDKTFGDAPLAVSAPVASSGLPVTLTVKSGPGTISNNVLTITGAGLIRLSANQAGNGNFFPATPVNAAIVVNKAPQSIQFNPQTTLNYTNKGTFPLSATSSSGKTIKFSSSNPSVLSITGSTAMMKSKGTVVVTATAPGDANTLPGVATASITLQ